MIINFEPEIDPTKFTVNPTEEMKKALEQAYMEGYWRGLSDGKKKAYSLIQGQIEREVIKS